MIISSPKDAITVIEKGIKRAVEEEGKRRFVIYTNGVGGICAKECLKNKYLISPEYTIDNKVSNGTTILSLEQAKRRNNENVYFLVCSWNTDFYSEIRRAIYETFPENQIIDLFKNEGEVLPSEEEICDILHYIEGYIK